MKKYSAVFLGVSSSLYFYIVLNFIFIIADSDYNKKYALIENIMILVLPVLPGIANVFLLIRDSFKKFIKSLICCVFASLFLIITLLLSETDLSLYFWFTGHNGDFSLGEGFLFAVIFNLYFISCFIGAAVSGAISIYRQIKNKREIKYEKTFKSEKAID